MEYLAVQLKVEEIMLSKMELILRRMKINLNEWGKRKLTLLKKIKIKIVLAHVGMEC